MRLLSIILGLNFILPTSPAEAAKGFFRKHDVNRDGVVTLIEFRETQNFECNLDDKQRRFEKRDKNLDDMLSREEFMTCSAKNKHCDPLKRAQRFKKKDINQDDMLSKEEFITCSANHIQDRFDVLDINHDGRITKKERQQMRGK